MWWDSQSSQCPRSESLQGCSASSDSQSVADAADIGARYENASMMGLNFIPVSANSRCASDPVTTPAPA